MAESERDRGTVKEITEHFFFIVGTNSTRRRI